MTGVMTGVRTVVMTGVRKKMMAGVRTGVETKKKQHRNEYTGSNNQSLWVVVTSHTRYRIEYRIEHRIEYGNKDRQRKLWDKSKNLDGSVVRTED